MTTHATAKKLMKILDDCDFLHKGADSCKCEEAIREILLKYRKSQINRLLKEARRQGFI